MATPVGHSLMGMSIFLIFNRWIKFKQNWQELILYIFLANLPDLDFLPVFFYGFEIANKGHHTWTHSLGFAILITLIGGLIVKFKKGKAVIKFSLIIFILILSHLIIDFFAQDTRAPYGIMFFWPFTKQYFISSCPIFLSVAKSSLRTLISVKNCVTILRELIIFLPLVIILFLINKRRRKIND